MQTQLSNSNHQSAIKQMMMIMDEGGGNGGSSKPTVKRFHIKRKGGIELTGGRS